MPPCKKKYQWLRPIQICSDAKFFADGVSRFDVNQGEIGNCWFIAAMANLTLNKTLFDQVVCADNCPNFKENYVGIFHFRFWHFGKFIDVVIDDRLPTRNGKLVFGKSTDRSEFWSALLEKAYAKIYGGYKALNSGFSSEAFEDFSGGVVEVYNLKERTPPKAFQYICKALKRNVLITCGILHSSSKLPNLGLFSGHAYSITGAQALSFENIIRVRNPWGNEMEWRGRYSDNSKAWDNVPFEIKKKLEVISKGDGEFWISFDDFKSIFDIMKICNINPDINMTDPNPTRKWNLISHHDEFSSKREFIINLVDPDEDDDENFCTAVIALMQKDYRKKRQHVTPFGFNLYLLNGSEKKFIRKIKNDHTRETCGRYELPPGKYCIMPFAESGEKNLEYLLRVFYETKIVQGMYPSFNKSLEKATIPVSNYPKNANLRATSNNDNCCCVIM